MRISVLTRSLTRGGAQVQVATLARGLAARGHDVSVVCFYAGGALAPSVRDSGARLVELRKSGRYSAIAPLKRLLRHLRESRAQVVYSFLPMENLFGLVAARRAGIPIVWGIRGASINRAQFGLASRLLYGLQFSLIRKPDAVVCNSYAAARELEPSRQSRLHVVPNGIDLERYSPSPERRAAWRAQQGFHPDEKVIGIVARLDPMKDHANFLRAAATVARQVPRSRFLVAGGGAEAYAGSLRKIAADLGLDGRIKWLGEVAEPADVHRGIDVMVSASAWGEGFSNALGEAMACGAAVVATDIGDSRKIVEAHGRVVAAGNSPALSDAIVAMIEADSMEARVARRQWIESQFGVDVMVSRTEQILRDVAGDAAAKS